MRDRKMCTKCKVVKPITDYYKKLESISGRRPECKGCSKKYSKSSVQKEVSAGLDCTGDWMTGGLEAMHL